MKNERHAEEQNEAQTELEPRLPREIVARILAQIAINRPEDLVETILIGRGFWIPYNYALFWEPICRHVYPELTAGILDMTPYTSYYNLFRTRPTLRFDGLYVCMSRYFCDGEVQGISFYRPKHEVRYYRYLWFRPQGTVRTLLSNYPPRRILRLDAGAAAPNLTDAMTGEWLFDKETNELHIDADGGSVRNHRFYFELEVASSGGKVHNKLKWKSYFCVDKTTGVKTDVNVNNEGSYYFQRLDGPESTFQ